MQVRIDRNRNFIPLKQNQDIASYLTNQDEKFKVPTRFQPIKDKLQTNNPPLLQFNNEYKPFVRMPG